MKKKSESENRELQAEKKLSINNDNKAFVDKVHANRPRPKHVDNHVTSLNLRRGNDLEMKAIGLSSFQDIPLILMIICV